MSTFTHIQIKYLSFFLYFHLQLTPPQKKTTPTTTTNKQTKQQQPPHKTPHQQQQKTNKQNMKLVLLLFDLPCMLCFICIKLSFKVIHQITNKTTPSSVKMSIMRCLTKRLRSFGTSIVSKRLADFYTLIDGLGSIICNFNLPPILGVKHCFSNQDG